MMLHNIFFENRYLAIIQNFELCNENRSEFF